MSRIFISYRRSDSAKWAEKIYDSLRMRYGENLIFRDADSIPPGTDWNKTISGELGSSFATLVLIGPDWLNAENGRRLNDPGDVLRTEIIFALSGTGTVIPVLVGGAAMPPADALPDAMKKLPGLQTLVIRDDSWGEGIDSLVGRLRVLVGPTRDEIPLEAAQQELFRLQERYFGMLDTNASAALDLFGVTEKYLDRVMPLYPQDPVLKVTRGYLFKNRAMALGGSDRKDEIGKALDEGELIFRTMIDENPDDAGAWNGLGSIESVRGNYETGVSARISRYEKALGYITAALDINPDYEHAKEDQKNLHELLKDPGKKDPGIKGKR